MPEEKLLSDLDKRARQLELHILSSTDYLRKVQRELFRQVMMIFLCISLLGLFQVLLAFDLIGHRLHVTLTGGVSLMAVVNCLLIIRIKNSLSNLNENWINPEERSALRSLKRERKEVLQKKQAGYRD